MSVVLLVEPDTSQANLLRTMQKRLGAELVLVPSIDAAIETIMTSSAVSAASAIAVSRNFFFIT